MAPDIPLDVAFKKQADKARAALLAFQTVLPLNSMSLLKPAMAELVHSTVSPSFIIRSTVLLNFLYLDRSLLITFYLLLLILFFKS